MDALLQDIRHAARALSRARGFTILAVLTLALGLGVNTTVFSVASAFLLAEPDFVEPDGLVVLNERRTVGDRIFPGVSWPTFEDWRASAGTLDHVAFLR